ncbi:MAG: hypothetical protein ACKOTD_01335, partial [Phycisphaerales bacterium]
MNAAPNPRTLASARSGHAGPMRGNCRNQATRRIATIAATASAHQNASHHHEISAAAQGAGDAGAAASTPAAAEFAGWWLACWCALAVAASLSLRRVA